MNRKQIESEQLLCLKLKRKGKTREAIAKQLGMSVHQVKRRLSAALKRERIDPALLAKLEDMGLQDLSGLRSGWIMEKDSTGSGGSLYFDLGPDQEKFDFVDAIQDVLADIPKMPPIPGPNWQARAKDLCNWLFLADLHIGGEYGSKEQSKTFEKCVDDLIARMPPAEKAVLVELGDLLDANDHKGVTPASGNPTDTIRDNHLFNTIEAIRILKYAAYRLLENHMEVELHMIRGNHDETAFYAVLLALQEHFAENPRMTVIVPRSSQEEEFRVISWGECACFPHHGDKAKPEALKEVFTDQFPDEYAQAKAYRLIATGHLHHLLVKSMGNCEHRQFGTIHRPNRWARMKGFFGYGRLSVLTVHKTEGLTDETISNIRPMLRGEVQ